MCTKITVWNVFACILFQICQNSNSKVRKVVQQHTEGMMGNIICVLLESYLAFQQ